MYTALNVLSTPLQISTLKAADSNNNCSNIDDSSSVKASSSSATIQDKDFILELLCWHNEYRYIYITTQSVASVRSSVLRRPEIYLRLFHSLKGTTRCNGSFDFQRGTYTLILLV